MTDDVKKKLANELGPVQWSDLKAHAERGGMLMVDPSLDLLEVAVAVATDASASVRQWLTSEKLVRPSAEQIGQWGETPSRPFDAVVVQPFALAQLVDPSELPQGDKDEAAGA